MIDFIIGISIFVIIIIDIIVVVIIGIYWLLINTVLATVDEFVDGYKVAKWWCFWICIGKS